jgi:hypothetical protein
MKVEIGDCIRAHDPPSILHPKLRGSFKIISKTTNGNLGSFYTCENQVTNKPEDFYVTKLQPMIYDEKKVNPLEYL